MGKQKIRLLSWNVQRPGRGRIDTVISAIESLAPDIVTLQEANDQTAKRLRELGLEHQVYGRDGSYPSGIRDHVPKHAALVASRWPLGPDIGWTGDACYPTLFARAHVTTPSGLLDVVTAHIPNGSSNGWRKAQHCQVLGRVLRNAPPAPRVLTGDFNEPQAFLADGRVVSFAAGILESTGLALTDSEVERGTEGIPGPHPWREWDRAVCDLLTPGFHGLTHAHELTNGSMRPMPVTYVTRPNPRFFDHALVSRSLRATVEYLHDLRTTGVSDHSALMLVLRHVVPDAGPDWAPR